ncbi:hypothetical protein O181_098904 [Austropuccinia psidii MF-1]|uniref:Uncharacterized protein n=1 Tax=Austropuccinia psidii MF-1 TaxID=1389203 RepID=A0A9Q3PEZ5_9BASI|nr:hypothetical protein [Austropuccinia psidii MF-1]
MKDGDADRTFKLGPIVTMGFKCQKQNPPNPLQQDSPVPCIRCKKTPKQSTEELFACPATPSSIMIINNTPIGSPPAPSSPQSHNEAWQVFTALRLTLMNPRAIVHNSINQISLEHQHFLHMIPFMNVTHQNEMHWEFWEELNSLLGQALEVYSKEDITGIVSKYLEE